MLPSVSLPEFLQKQYDEIAATFDVVHNDWKKYADEIIPEDTVIVKGIINFIVGVIEYMESNYAKLDVQKWTEFLHDYYYQFYYGPMGDDHNYLDFDEIPLGEMLLFEINEDKPLTKSKLKALKNRLLTAQKKIT